MFSIRNPFRIVADRTQQRADKAFLHQSTLVRRAMPSAMESYRTSPEAAAFIDSIQTYQASLQTVCADKRTLPEGLVEQYNEARLHAGRNDQTRRDLLQAELALTRTSSMARAFFDQMVQSGMHYMQTVPALVSEVPVSKADMLWASAAARRAIESHRP